MKLGSVNSRRAARRLWGGLIWASPGQIDAGLASFATFAAGIFSIRFLPPASLGVYGLLFAAFQVANQVSTELVFIPSQVLALSQSNQLRLGMVRNSIPRGSAIAGLAAIFVPIGAIPVIQAVSTNAFAALALTATFLAFVSPIQDHLRSMFHLTTRSWLAAFMSIVHLLVTGAGLAFGSVSDPTWAPFGALAIGNVASLCFAAVMIRRIAPEISPRPSRSELTSLGGWLLVTGFVRTASSYVTRVLLNAIAGIASLGFVEAARIVSQPINVLALGLMAQVGPRLTRASASKEGKEAKRWRRRFYFLLAAIALPYVLLTAAPWPINPLAVITPRAYESAGLTAAMLIAVTTACVLRPLRAELLGIRRQRSIAGVGTLSSLMEIFIVFAGAVLGSFVIPLGLFVGAVTAALLYGRILRGIYKEFDL